MLTREKYLELVNRHIKNKNLVKHCLAVEAAMRELAKYFNANENKWAALGLIHDADWEKTMNEPSKHTQLTVEWLKQAGENDQEIIEGVLAHNYKHNGYRQPASKMEWALYTCDELTGLIVATALVRPDKKLASVTVESVLKKFPAKAFAAAVDREQIRLCEEKLGIALFEFVDIVLSAMKKVATELGL